MDGNRDHCGQWIKRAQKDQLFEGESLNCLDETHDDFHTNALAIQIKYQEGKLDVAREGLASLQSTFDEMNNVLRLFK